MGIFTRLIKTLFKSKRATVNHIEIQMFEFLIMPPVTLDKEKGRGGGAHIVFVLSVQNLNLAHNFIHCMLCESSKDKLKRTKICCMKQQYVEFSMMAKFYYAWKLNYIDCSKVWWYKSLQTSASYFKYQFPWSNYKCRWNKCFTRDAQYW